MEARGLIGTARGCDWNCPWNGGGGGGGGGDTGGGTGSGTTGVTFGFRELDERVDAPNNATP